MSTNKRWLIEQLGPKGKWVRHMLRDGDLVIEDGRFTDEEDAGLGLGHRRAEYREFKFRAVRITTRVSVRGNTTSTSKTRYVERW